MRSSPSGTVGVTTSCTDARRITRPIDPLNSLIAGPCGQADDMFPAAILAGAIGSLFWIITVVVILAIIGAFAIVKKVL